MSQAPLTPHSLKFIRLVRPLYDVNNPSLIDGYGCTKISHDRSAVGTTSNLAGDAIAAIAVAEPF